MNLKNVKVLVIDEGNSVELAVKLVPYFKEVFYCTTFEDAFPGIQKAFIGYGVDGVQLIHCEVFAHYDEKTDYNYDDIGLFICTDVYSGDLQQHLVEDGKNVFGCRLGEELELDRVYFKKMLKKLGLPVGEYEVLKGLDKLDEFLQTAKGTYYVKISEYRGIKETFKFDNYKEDMSILWRLKQKLGYVRNLITFVADKKIDSLVESGIDTWYIDGNHPNIAFYGYELKDELYVIKAETWSKIPKCLTEINDKFAKIFEDYGCRGSISTEVRLMKDKTNYFIDPCMRQPSPPGECIYDMIENTDEIFFFGAKGKIVEPILKFKYGVIAYIYSGWSEENPCAVSFPKEIRQFVKLKHCCKIDGVYNILPQYPPTDQIGAVIGLGNTLDEAIEQCKKNAEQVSGTEIEIKTDRFADVMEVIEKGRSIGIDF